MSDTPRTDAALSAGYVLGNGVPFVLAEEARKMEVELAAVTAERDALRKIIGNMLLYWETGNHVPIERATIRADDPIVESMRAALRKEGA